MPVNEKGHLVKIGAPREFPGGPVVKPPHFHCHGPGSVPGQATEIPQAMCHSQKKKKKIGVPQ